MSSFAEEISNFFIILGFNLTLSENVIVREV